MTRKKRVATTDDLPISTPPIDSKPETIWDPAGTIVPEPPAVDCTTHVIDPTTVHAQHDLPDDEDAQLEEFLAAVRAIADKDTEIETPQTWSRSS